MLQNENVSEVFYNEVVFQNTSEFFFSTWIFIGGCSALVETFTRTISNYVFSDRSRRVLFSFFCSFSYTKTIGGNNFFTVEIFLVRRIFRVGFFRRVFGENDSYYSIVGSWRD